IAQALRMLADAIETPAQETAPSAASAPASAPATPAPAAPKPRGRPAKGESAPSAPAAAPAPAAAAPAAAPASNLTHAIVANDFKAAAAAHGRDFVAGLLKKHGAATFDKVKDLETFQAELKAGPQAAAAPANNADDLLG